MSIKDEGKRASDKSRMPEKREPNVIRENAVRDPRLQKTIDFMSGNLDRRIRLAELAEKANLSAFRFSHHFKTETGVSPGEYLRRLRMEMARHLLDTTRLSIKQIMASTGYGNRSHFVRHFKRSHGLAPSQYRKRGA